MNRSAFTLLQAILLLFGLALIAAILFPVFVPGRRTEGYLSCQSHLKQITLGFKQYTQDYDDKYPPIVLEPPSRAALGAPYGWTDAVLPYLRSLQIFQCPDEPNRDASLYKSWQPGVTDYYLNRRIAAVEESKFPNSALTVALADGNDGLDVNDARYTRDAVPLEWLKDENSPVYRHRGGANYGFVDGHVKWLKAEQAPGTAPSKNGRFTFAR
jgi:prepilin-type processing-associated H-X9-DG protein